MKTDIALYMERPVEDLLPYLIAPSAPFALEGKVLDSYRLRARDLTLEGIFVYTSPDFSAIGEDPLHLEAQKALGFQPRSHLLYDGRNLSSEKAAACIGILYYFSAYHISHYMTVTNESGEEALVSGDNPATGAAIHNPCFQQSLFDLVKEPEKQ